MGKSNMSKIDLKEKIFNAIIVAVNSENTTTLINKEELELEKPTNLQHGDYSSNIALQSFEIVKQSKSADGLFAGTRKHPSSLSGTNPREMANNIREKLLKDSEFMSIIEKIEVAGAGFINFWVKDEILIGNLKDVLEKQNHYGKTDNLKGKRIMFEYGDANTHKLPHIGHLFSYIFGDSVTHILEANGAEVFRASYQGDVGLHVAKCLWAYQKENPEVPEELADKVQLLQKMYQHGNQAFEENEQAKQEIKEVNKSIYNQDPEIYGLWQQTRQWSVDFYKQFEERLGIEYDRYFYESEVYAKGKEIVERNVGKVFKKSEGALIFEGSKFGLHDRVFVTQYGTPTYEAKEMYLQELKRKEWQMDKLIITTAHEQNDYFKVVFKALETLDQGYSKILKHIGFGMVSLTSGKMGSRHGNIVRAIELVELVVEEIKKVIQARDDLSETEKEEIAEIVGVGAVKYYFLKNNPVQDIKYDVDKSVSIDGNSGPYLQYTYARTQSVLRNMQKDNWEAGNGNKKSLHPEADYLKGEESRPPRYSEEGFASEEFHWDLGISNLKLETEEASLLRTFIHYSGAIIDAGKNYSPNILANYLYDLAQKYNTFYNIHRIVDPEGGEEVQKFRIALTAATGQLLKNGLELLGIRVPERM